MSEKENELMEISAKVDNLFKQINGTNENPKLGLAWRVEMLEQIAIQNQQIVIQNEKKKDQNWKFVAGIVSGVLTILIGAWIVSKFHL